jgi:hypothetical protein
VKDDVEVDHFFKRFCDAIFAHPWLGTAQTTKILTVERNTGYEAGRLASLFKSNYAQHPILCVLEKKSAHSYGWWTSAQSKAAYAQQLWIKMSEGAIYYLDSMVCVNPWVDESHRRERTIKELEAELARFRPHHKEPTNVFAKPSVTYSGKGDAEGKIQKGLNDDKAMSLAMNLYIMMRVQTRSIPTIDYTRLFGRNGESDATRYRGVKRSVEGQEASAEATAKRHRLIERNS